MGQSSRTYKNCRFGKEQFLGLSRACEPILQTRKVRQMPHASCQTCPEHLLYVHAPVHVVCVCMRTCIGVGGKASFPERCGRQAGSLVSMPTAGRSAFLPTLETDGGIAREPAEPCERRLLYQRLCCPFSPLRTGISRQKTAVSLRLGKFCPAWC